MKTVKHMLQNKPPRVISVTSTISVLEALQVMMENNISALLVIEGGNLLGIFTERDYARKIILMGRSSRETPIGDVMTANPHTVAPSDTSEYCMQLMTERHFRHLPVVENGEVAGIISIGDAVKSIIEEQQQTISQLQHYISS
jgi:CBS domain-containing protein